jgi:hypothetical protein
VTRRQHALGITITAIVLAAASGTAYGEPSPSTLHMRTPSTLTTDGGTTLHLPPGYFQDEPTHDKLDAEIRRLQDQEVRLTAEGKSLRASLGTWQPGWLTLAATIVVGGAAGWYLHDRL